MEILINRWCGFSGKISDFNPFFHEKIINFHRLTLKIQILEGFVGIFFLTDQGCNKNLDLSSVQFDPYETQIQRNQIESHLDAFFFRFIRRLKVDVCGIYVGIYGWGSMGRGIYGTGIVLLIALFQQSIPSPINSKSIYQYRPLRHPLMGDPVGPL